ncbi:MAG: hypothetical protein SGJ24_09715 [Chloroflexota bacterium]|nr:hypothetical protein [Chloroflexota bacterium]
MTTPVQTQLDFTQEELEQAQRLARRHGFDTFAAYVRAWIRTETVGVTADKNVPDTTQDAANEMQPAPATNYYTATALLEMPREERERISAAIFALAANEDFEIFEADGDMIFDDEYDEAHYSAG